MSSSSTNGGVPPGFRFHPTDEELLHYYLKKKISFQKFDMEVIREVDLNKIEPWDLQETCKIGSTPQNEWYFFSHKDRKYPTGSRTNRATNAGFWKATGRDKCIRNTFKKIGMRKTLVFYRGRAPHGQKTDWIMHEYRLEDGDHQDPLSGNPSSSEDGWVICRVFKKKNLFKVGGNDQGSPGGGLGGLGATMGSSDQLNNLTNQPSRMFPHSLNRDTNQYLLHHHHHHQQQQQQNFVDLGLNYTHIPHVPLPHYPHLQAQNFIPTHKSLGGGYVVDDFSASLPSDNSPVMVMQLISNPQDQCDSGGSDQQNHLGIYNQCGDQEPPAGGTLEQDDNNCEANSQSMNDDQWGVVDHHRLVETVHLGHDHHEEVNPPPSSSSMHQINQLSLRGEMNFWGYGK